jgi:hypothetical protein
MVRKTRAHFKTLEKVRSQARDVLYANGVVLE